MEQQHHDGQAPVEGAVKDTHPPQAVHLPGPSYWPLVLSVCLVVLAFGVIFQPILAVIAALAALVAIIAWGLEGGD